MERIQKTIANSGYCSRRKAEELIALGKVKVNGVVSTEVGRSIDPEVDKIEVERHLIKTDNAKVVYVLNKPKGVVCSTKKQADEAIITDLVPSSPVVYPVGRLDKESEGLIFLTNDGEFTNFLLHPKNAKYKKYHVIAKKDPKAVAEKIEKALLKGVKLGDGIAKADSVEIISENYSEMTIIIKVHEGRNHLIRRMLAVLDLKVKLLRRIEIAGIKLTKLPPGKYRTLTSSEKGLIYSNRE